MKPFAKGAHADPAVSRGRTSELTEVMTESAVAERREMCMKDNMVVDICLIVENENEDEIVIKQDLDRQYC